MSWRIRWLIALLLPLAQATAAEGMPEKAEHFIGGFEPVFAETRTFFELVRACREQFASTCGQSLDRDVPKLASLARAMTMFTVFDTKGAAASKLQTEDDLVQRMSATLEGFNRELLIFDKDLLQRYRALISVCPYKTATLMPPHLDVTFPRYWQLSEQAYAETKQQIDTAARDSARAIRDWPIERCRSARNFGAVILYSLEIRLEPYDEKNWETIPRSRRLETGLAHAFAIAATFEEQIHPDFTKDAEAMMLEMERKNPRRKPDGDE